MNGRIKRMRKLLSVANAEERQCSMAMGQAMGELEAAQARLNELARYRQDYAARETAAGRVDAVRWQDYQSFLARLDSAVAAQRDVIAAGDAKVEAHRRRWMATRQRLKSLARVIERLQGEEHRRSARSAQKRQDDMRRAATPFDAD